MVEDSGYRSYLASRNRLHRCDVLGGSEISISGRCYWCDQEHSTGFKGTTGSRINEVRGCTAKAKAKVVTWIGGWFA